MTNLAALSEMASLCLNTPSWKTGLDNFEKVLILRIGLSCSTDMINSYTPHFIGCKDTGKFWRVFYCWTCRAVKFIRLFTDNSYSGRYFSGITRHSIWSSSSFVRGVDNVKMPRRVLSLWGWILRLSVLPRSWLLNISRRDLWSVATNRTRHPSVKRRE